MKIIREKESNRVIFMFTDTDDIELLEGVMFANRRAYYSVCTSTHEIVDAPKPETWADNGALMFDGSWHILDGARVKEAALKDVLASRAAEYPPVADYLDGIVKNDQAQIQAYIDACLAVKAKYPKP